MVMNERKHASYSVLMTVYIKDNPEYVKLSIESMLNQTIKTNDFVLVLDGSITSELDSMISSFCEDNPGVFHIF